MSLQPGDASRHEELYIRLVAIHNQSDSMARHWYLFGYPSCDRVGNLNGQREQRFQFQRLVADHVLQRLAVQVFHGDECLAILLTNVVNGADIGMIQSGSGPGFSAETLQGLLGPSLHQGISALQSDQGGCPRPYTLHPFLHRPACRRCGSAIWSGRRVGREWPLAGILGRTANKVNRNAQTLGSGPSRRQLTPPPGTTGPHRCSGHR